MDFMLFRFPPQEMRAIGLAATNLDILGKALFSAGRYERAMDAFGLAQRYGGVNRFEQMGYMFQSKGVPKASRVMYDRALSVGVESETLFANYGTLLDLGGESRAAEKILLNGLRHYPQSPTILRNLHVVYYHLRDVKKMKAIEQRLGQLNG
jgi:Flp pilus assembly protein TadD